MTSGADLKLINASAAPSLDKDPKRRSPPIGWANPMKKKSLKTTNVIESALALVVQKVDSVDYWKNSDQKQRGCNNASVDRAIV